MVTLKLLDDQSRHVWRVILEISRHQPRGWTLIGAQMVALHGFEHGRVTGHSSLDADLLIDVRTVQNGTERFGHNLIGLGFQLEGINADGISHRFRRDAAEVIDILAPDGLVLPKPLSPSYDRHEPYRSLVAGRRLRRTELVEVNLDDILAEVPRPGLLGAVLLKARAVDVDDVLART